MSLKGKIAGLVVVAGFALAGMAPAAAADPVDTLEHHIDAQVFGRLQNTVRNLDRFVDQSIVGAEEFAEDRVEGLDIQLDIRP